MTDKPDARSGAWVSTNEILSRVDTLANEVTRLKTLVTIVTPILSTVCATIVIKVLELP